MFLIPYLQITQSAETIPQNGVNVVKSEGWTKSLERARMSCI